MIGFFFPRCLEGKKDKAMGKCVEGKTLPTVMYIFFYCLLFKRFSGKSATSASWLLFIGCWDPSCPLSFHHVDDFDLVTCHMCVYHVGDWGLSIMVWEFVNCSRKCKDKILFVEVANFVLLSMVPRMFEFSPRS